MRRTTSYCMYGKRHDAPYNELLYVRAYRWGEAVSKH